MKLMVSRNFIAAVIAATVAMFLLSSCATTADRISDIVDDSIERAEDLTAEEWAERDRLIEELLREYQEHPEKLTEEDRQMIDYQLGRYYGEQMKQGIEVAKKSMEDFLNRLPSLFEGFIDGLDGLLEESDSTAE